MKLKTIVLATGNKHKVEEISAIIKDISWEIRTLRDYPDIGEINEDAPDFKGNALIKAVAVMKFTGLPSLADDSGLEVDALGGAPGVLSARFSGKGDSANNELLLKKLVNVADSDRMARFRCVIALVIPQKEPIFAEGKVEGKILQTLSGENGFGYDPLFLPDGYKESFAQLPSSEKNKISHRGRALADLRMKLTVA
jgi:XTP/dITP diphosphohydrolase